jgi:hypothetical protein
MKNPSNVSEFRKKMSGMAQVCRALNGLDATRSSRRGLAESFEAALADETPGVMAFNGAQVPVAEVMEAGRLGDVKALRALQALRMENVELFVKATSNFLMFFEPVTLKDNEQPVMIHAYKNPTNVRYTGEDGGARTVKAVKAQKQVFPPLRALTSARVGYQIRDINQGTDIAAAADATVNVAWDLMNKEDEELFNLLNGGTINGTAYGNGCYAAFNTGSAKLDKTFIPHARIATANLPTTNLITNANVFDLVNGVPTGAVYNRFRLGVIRAIMTYCASWGNIFGGPLMPTGAILIPSSEVTQITNEIQPTGTFYNEVASQILNSYTMFEYMGVNWTLVGDPTLPPGACYPVLNRKVGQVFHKPSWDEEFVTTDREKNWEEKLAQKVFAAAIWEPWRVNALKVVYSSVAGAGVVTQNE